MTSLKTSSAKDPDKVVPRDLFFQVVGVLARYDGYIILTKADGMEWADRLLEKSRDMSKQPITECLWHVDEDGTYHTDCGNMYIINHGETPEESGMKYCTYCGKPVRSGEEQP